MVAPDSRIEALEVMDKLTSVNRTCVSFDTGNACWHYSYILPNLGSFDQHLGSFSQNSVERVEIITIIKYQLT